MTSDGQGDAMTGDAATADDLLQRARAAYLDTAIATPPDLVETAMRTVAVELRPGRRVPMDDVPGVRAFATDVAVANALRVVLDADPSVVARRCRVEPVRGAVRVHLSLAVSYVHWHRHRDAVVRASVAAAARELFGLTVEAVDLDVVDLLDTAVLDADL